MRAPSDTPAPRRDTSQRPVAHASETRDLLEEQLARYRRLFDFAPDGYVVTDGAGVVQDANQAACRLLDRERRHIEGRPFLVQVARADHQRFLRLLGDAAGAGAVVETELHLRRRSGGTVAVSAHVAATDDEPGVLLWLLHDVSRQKKAEETLEEALGREREATGRLRELDDLKNVLLLAVSHDLSGPVHAMVELSAMAAAVKDSDRRQLARILAAIRANALLVQRVQANLLDYDRLSRGAVRVQRGDVRLDELVQRALAGVDATGRELRVRAQPATARIDASLAERILHNLLSNAVQHTAGDVPMEVEASLQDGVVRIVVTDHGDGIPASLRTAVFEPFTGADRRDGWPGGIGVGLYVVSRFAALHGGRAWVDDTPGGGARLTVELAVEGT